MNFVFISPNFPESYRYFCICLRQSGVNVLGIGDSSYDELQQELKQNLSEYYRVDSLEDYDSVLRAVGYFTGKYGKIDWIESNNEYWLELDAALRTDFNINTGVKLQDLEKYKRKSLMKEYFRIAGIPVARSLLVTDKTEEKEILEFARLVGYPIVAKPDTGVGATATYKILSDSDAVEFSRNHPAVDYLLEEFIPGEVTTYDGIINSKGKVLFAASHITPNSIMDMVNEHKPVWYYVDKDVPADISKAGKAVLNAFEVRSRSFHLEFFRLTEKKEGLGEKGDIVALEVNMRPAGGYTTDMINYSQSADYFRVWADMVVYDDVHLSYNGPHRYCVFAGRRDDKRYTFSQEDVMNWCGDNAKLFTHMDNALSAAMGNQVCIACMDTLEEIREFVEYTFC